MTVCDKLRERYGERMTPQIERVVMESVGQARNRNLDDVLEMMAEAVAQCCIMGDAVLKARSPEDMEEFILWYQKKVAEKLMGRAVRDPSRKDHQQTQNARC